MKNQEKASHVVLDHIEPLWIPRVTMNDPKTTPQKLPTSENPALKKVTFQQLSQGAAEVLVEHDGQVYRLRLTRNGKLILNK